MQREKYVERKLAPLIKFELFLGHKNHSKSFNTPRQITELKQQQKRKKTTNYVDGYIIVRPLSLPPSPASNLNLIANSDSAEIALGARQK